MKTLARKKLEERALSLSQGWRHIIVEFNSLPIYFRFLLLTPLHPNARFNYLTEGTSKRQFFLQSFYVLGLHPADIWNTYSREGVRTKKGCTFGKIPINIPLFIQCAPPIHNIN